MTVFVGVLAALAAGAAYAQPPQPATDNPAASAEVCLTNACSTRPRPIAAPKTAAEAIVAGNAQAVRDLGGRPSQALDAIMTRLNKRISGSDPADVSSAMVMAGHIAEFADTSGGVSLSYGGAEGFSAPPGIAIVGSIVRQAPDGSTQTFWLTDNGGGIWVLPGYQQPGGARTTPRG